MNHECIYPRERLYSTVEGVQHFAVKRFSTVRGIPSTISSFEGVQYCKDTPSVLWRIFSTLEGNYGYYLHWKTWNHEECSKIGRYCFLKWATTFLVCLYLVWSSHARFRPLRTWLLCVANGYIPSMHCVKFGPPYCVESVVDINMEIKPDKQLPVLESSSIWDSLALTSTPELCPLINRCCPTKSFEYVQIAMEMAKEKRKQYPLNSSQGYC